MKFEEILPELRDNKFYTLQRWNADTIKIGITVFKYNVLGTIYTMLVKLIKIDGEGYIELYEPTSEEILSENWEIINMN